MVGKSVLNHEGKVTGQREIRPVWNNAQRVNHQNKLTHPHPKSIIVPTTVLTKSGKVPVNTAKQSSPRAAVSNSTARYVNTAASRPTVNGTKPSSNVIHKSHSSVKRTFYQKSTAKTNYFKEKVNTASFNNIWRPTGNVIDHISKDSGSYMLKRFDIFDLQVNLKWMLQTYEEENSSTSHIFKILMVDLLHLEEVLKELLEKAIHPFHPSQPTSLSLDLGRSLDYMFLHGS
ncbi:hypothetical protein Tco_0088421 [Tanacetum coccineum]